MPITLHIRTRALGVHTVTWAGHVPAGDVLVAEAHAAPAWRAVADILVPPGIDDRNRAITLAVMSYVDHLAAARAATA
ncbi:hypothetical protein [Actinokineospora sp.]|uniref:hypothetical protein n=1 Tax=Actinokineospora sp. TaxID=1872133 RepID=UPI004037D706